MHIRMTTKTFKKNIAVWLVTIFLAVFKCFGLFLNRNNLKTIKVMVKTVRHSLPAREKNNALHNLCFIITTFLALCVHLWIKKN